VTGRDIAARRRGCDRGPALSVERYAKAWAGHPRLTGGGRQRRRAEDRLLGAADEARFGTAATAGIAAGLLDGKAETPFLFFLRAAFYLRNPSLEHL
jgi:hypothetical protein